MKRTFLWLAMGMASVSIVVGQRSPVTRLDGSTMSTAEVDGAMTRLMKAAEVTGAGIAIFHNGKIADLRG